MQLANNKKKFKYFLFQKQSRKKNNFRTCCNIARERIKKAPLNSPEMTATTTATTTTTTTTTTAATDAVHNF